MRLFNNSLDWICAVKNGAGNRRRTDSNSISREGWRHETMEVFGQQQEEKNKKGWISKLSSCLTCQVKWNNDYLCVNAYVCECWHECTHTHTRILYFPVHMFMLSESLMAYVDGKICTVCTKIISVQSLIWACTSKSVCPCVHAGPTDQLEQGNEVRTCQEEAARSLLFISSASAELKHQKLRGCAAAQLLCLCNLTAGRWLTYCMRSVYSYSTTGGETHFPCM